MEEVNWSERAWSRYLLAQAYHYRFEHFDKNPEYMALAAEYSPDVRDVIEKQAFLPDALMFTGQIELLKYRIAYCSWLDEDGNHEEALEEMAAIAFAYPSEGNMKFLIDYYANYGGEQGFPIFWQAYINSKGTEVPNLKLRFSKYHKVNLKEKSNKWLMFDFWGGWCPPCVKEMPQVQAFYHENLTRGGVPKLMFYSLSFMSEDLSQFMEENDYTFPVEEIDRGALEAFGVSNFPTKVLVTPERKFIIIPHGLDWKLYVENYVML